MIHPSLQLKHEAELFGSHIPLEGERAFGSRHEKETVRQSDPAGRQSDPAGRQSDKSDPPGRQSVRPRSRQSDSQAA